MSVQPALNQPIPPGGDWWNLGASKALRNLLLLSVIAVFFVFAMANVTFGKDEYKNVSSNETTKGLQFKWYDIIGVETSSSITTDNAIQTGVPIGFTFYHSETTYTKINISENGFLWLGGETVVEGNQIMGQSGGAASDVVHVIAPLWDEYDITKNTSGRIYYQTLGKSPRRYFVVTWSEMAHKYSTPGDTVTFQAVLFENSSAILFNYLDASFGNASVDFGINATVGVENSTFGGTNFSVNSSSLKSSMSILFYFNDSTTRGLAASTRERSCYIPFDGMAIANNTTLCPGVFRINDSGNDAVITLNVGIEDIAVDCDNTEIVGNLTNGDQITGNEGINSNRNDGGTIRGCTLSNYSYNLRVIGGERVTLLENWLLSGYTGLRVEGPGNATSVNLSISNNTFANNTLGLYLDQMQTVNVSGNTFRDNTQFHISHSASNSTFWRNNFIGLPSGSVPYQSAGQNNSLNYSTEGNYWSTYDQEAEGCINAAAPFDQCDSPLPRSNLSQTIENITDFYPWVHQIDTNCTTPAENLTITWTQSLCGGEYRINDSAGQGVIFLPGTGLVLSCNNTILIGNSTVGSEGIRVTGYNMTLRGCTLRGYDTGINLRLGITNVTIINNSLINTSSGIYAQYLNNSVIRKNLFLNNTGTSSTGGGLVITANSVNNSILNNTFIGNSYGIHFEAASGQLLLNQIISNNTFWNHTVNAIYNTFSNTNGSIVHNNRFFNTSGIAIWSFGASMNFTNNSFTNNAGAMLFSGSNGTNNFVYYNNFTNNSRTNSFGSFEVSSAYVANYFNTSVGGVAQGNFWYDIFTNSLRIFDVDVNAFGDSGPHYPYNDSNGGNVTGNVTDWGPMLIDSDGDGDPDNVDCSPNNNLTLNPRNMTIRNNTAVTFCNGTFSFLSIDLSGYNELVTCNNTRFVGQYEGSLFQLLDVANGVSNLTLRNCFVSNYSTFVFFEDASSNFSRSNIRILNNTLVNVTRASGSDFSGINFRSANYSDVVIANNTMNTLRNFAGAASSTGIVVVVDTIGQFVANMSIFGNDIRDMDCVASGCAVYGIVVQVGRSAGSSNISVFNNTVGFSQCTGAGCLLVGIAHTFNTSVRIFNNTIAQLSSSQYALGVLTTSWNGTNITENTFTNITASGLGAGVYNSYGGSYGSGVLVERNTFSNVSVGVQFERESNHTIRNNTFVNV
ncbi:right-handed parallel beta-helix repeat-containing protein, partial [Candidatus Woesearchaeota archaeon]|nr:right-handed parallel beta-helix repeat-containing protein [Candidatus Woesearchaeota archaeon]